jgi:hypothetical protein
MEPKAIATRPDKGRGGKKNFPSTKFSPETEEDRKLVSKILYELLVEYQKERVTSDDELVDRLNDYFVRCAAANQIPTVEEMCMSTGYTYAACWDWETGRRKGFGRDTADIIKKAKAFMASFDAKLVVSGKMQFLTYCFRAKNYYGMKDVTEYNIEKRDVLGEGKSPEELLVIMKNAVPIQVEGDVE